LVKLTHASACPAQFHPDIGGGHVHAVGDVFKLQPLHLAQVDDHALIV
jgi:hypothetical protein